MELFSQPNPNALPFNISNKYPHFYQLFSNSMLLILSGTLKNLINGSI